MGLIDKLLHQPAGSDQAVVASDMEGTLSRGVTWKGIRDYMLAHGRKADFNRFFRRRIIRLPLFRLGLIDKQKFKEQWMVDLVALLAGMPRREFEAFSEWVVEHELWPNRRQRVIDELMDHMNEGKRVVVVSGLLEPMLAHFVAKIGCEAIGTPLKFAGDIFSGQTLQGFTTGAQKVAQLRPFLDINGHIAAAYGDTYADIPMLQLSQQPAAVFPDSQLKRHAENHGWRIFES